MDRLISLDELLMFPIRADHCDKEHANEDFINGIETVFEYVDTLPTVDAEPVRHGTWIRDEFGARCSDCGLYAYRDKFDKPWESPYCPICGAKMDAERKE